MKNLLTFVIMCLMAVPAFAQHDCHFGFLIEKQLQEHPGYAQEMAQLDQEIRTYLQQNPDAGNNRVVRTISVAVHVVYNTPAENVSTTSINNLINTLNADYRRTNSDASQTRAAFLGVAADAQIEFCLDTIIRRSTTKTCFDPDTEPNAMKSNSTNGSTPRDPRYYLNIWIVDLCGNTGGGVAGYAYLPTTGVPGSSIDGLVIDYSLGYDNGFGRTATHEIGHYLGLPHVWGSDSNPSCNTDDGFTDTPNSAGPNYNCSARNSCGTPAPGDQYENFMDYSYCPNMFTTQQANYMNGILTQRRSTLFSSPGCNSVVSNLPVANFIGTPTTVAVGGSVAFTDQSTNNPTQWSWTFAGGTPGTSTVRNPTITYNAPGTYTVTLTATNAFGNDSETKTAYITVVPAAGGCDTVDIFNNTDTLRLYYAGANTSDGYLSGHNSDGDVAKANRYTPLVSGSSVTGTFIRFGVAKTSGNRTVNVRVWDSDGANGVPGTVLASQTVPITSLSTTGLTYVPFSTPATVTGAYFVGVEFAYAAGDTVAIVTNSIYSGNPNYGWEKWSNGTWQPYTYYWQVSLKHVIFPVECVPGGNLPNANFTASATAVCAGGSINFTNTSTNATSYSWTFAGGTPGTSTQTNPSITYATPGTYTVTLVATGSNGQDTETRTNYITVRSRPVPTATATNVSCNGGNNGAVNVSVASGTAPYTYLWNGGAATQNRTGLTAGTYSVTVTDANGCTGTASATVTQPNAFTVSVANTAATCAGNNGTATASPNGGTSPYSYAWNTGGNGQTISGLAPGTYTVTVTTANGCTATGSTVVGGAVNNITLSTTTTQANCGQSNGSITLTRTGGTAPFTYAWSNGRNTQNNTGIPSGTYTVTVTDAAGCVATATATVTSTGGPTVSISNTTNVSCNGGNNGSLTATATGGTGPYTYNWSNGTSGATATNLSAGTYTVTVTAGGCSNTVTGTVGQPTAVTASVSNSTNVSCFGLNNGSATVTATGGSGSYTFNWGGFIGATRSSLAPGSYTVTATDGNGCSATTSVNITQPTQLNASATGANPGCTAANGSATVTATGGTTPYNYAWSNGQANVAANGLVAGTYTVTVTDNRGCTATASVNLTATSGPSVTTSSTSVGCGGTQDGTATAAVSGGTPPYSYAWNDDNNQISQTATNLEAGTYTVTVTDAAGCTVASTVTVLNIGPKIALSQTNVSGCFGNNNGSISLNVSGGTPPYNYSWSNGQSSQNVFTLTAGSYTVTVTDNGGCATTKTIVITEPSELQATVQVTPTNQGQNTGTASVSATGGTPPYTFAWSNGATGTSTGGLGVGNYTVAATDANGCVRTFNFTITVGTGVADVVAKLGVEVYPNPNTGRFVVNVLNNKGHETHVEVYNTLGQKVFVSETKTGTANGFEIDLGHMPANTYFVKVVSGDENVVRKVLRIN